MHVVEIEGDHAQTSRATGSGWPFVRFTEAAAIAERTGHGTWTYAVSRSCNFAYNYVVALDDR